MPGTHGKFANVFTLRPNGFEGSGLNDLEWGLGFSGTASAEYEIVIDGAGSPDTFKWRKNGGTWTTAVAITGAAQLLDDGQSIAFGATTGHSLNDRWSIGNLKDEPCTESGMEAQITDPAKRMLNPKADLTFTDSGGANLLRVDYVAGKAHFDANVAVVTVTGNNAYCSPDMLEKSGYLYEWKLDVTLNLSDITAFQESWKEWLAGLGEGSGSAAGFFASRKWFDSFKNCVEGNGPLFLLQLFTYDPADDQTGDHFSAWVIYDNFNLNAAVAEVVKEETGFKVYGMPSFEPNV